MALYLHGHHFWVIIHSLDEREPDQKILIIINSIKMETLVKTKQKIQLVDGSFTPSEALDVITSLLNEKINFHKLQRLSWYEGDQNANTNYPDGRIEELEMEKQIAKNFINSVRSEGKRLRIDGILKITLDD